MALLVASTNCSFASLMRRIPSSARAMRYDGRSNLIETCGLVMGTEDVLNIISTALARTVLLSLGTSRIESAR